VHEIFFQVFDKGWMVDSEGRYIDFRNTLILLTSNAAQDVVTRLCETLKSPPGPEALERAMRGSLIKVFSDALLNRLVVIPYYPISRETLDRIIRLQLGRVGRRVEENHRVTFTYEESVPDLIARRCSELERGARMVDSLITASILPTVGKEVLGRLTEGGAIGRVHLDTKDDDFIFSFDPPVPATSEATP